ncbi:hypothetical protein [Agromyces sp. Root81]|uniref:hypothetical protein n=1 Tax=Agromyces sp. Root81 TaxID=1736601 RepID=UPI0012FB6D83|nr:hypothetical protein [Agromyces sp. Root81]
MIAYILIFPVLLPVALVLVWLCIRSGMSDRYVAHGFLCVAAAVSALCLVAGIGLPLGQPDGQAGPEGSIGAGLIGVVLVSNGVLGLFATLVLAAMPWAGPRDIGPDRHRS